MKTIPLYNQLPKEHHANALKNAKKLGLDKIPNVRYKLTKLGAKVVSNRGYPDKFEVATGYVSFVGVDQYAWIVIESGFEWFKTSPILKVQKLKTGFKFETENSFYKLTSINVKKRSV